MKNSVRTLAAGSALVALALASSAFAATPISGSMDLKATASLKDGVISAINSSTDHFSGVPTPMNISVNAVVTDRQTGGQLIVTGQGTASGTANAGSIHFKNYGWTLAAPSFADANEVVDLFSTSNLPDWSYTFIAANNGTIDLSYNVLVTQGLSGNVFGLDGWLIGWSGAGSGLDVTNVSDPTASGVFTRSLVGGQTYTIELTNGSNLTGAVLSSSTNQIAKMSGDFAYTINDAAVPEPAMWSLMLAGFGLTGVAMRRRTLALAA